MNNRTFVLFMHMGVVGHLADSWSHTILAVLGHGPPLGPIQFLCMVLATADLIQAKS